MIFPLPDDEWPKYMCKGADRRNLMDDGKFYGPDVLTFLLEENGARRATKGGYS